MITGVTMGIIAALGTALCWAIAARLFRATGTMFSPLAMNFYKGVISILLLSVILIVSQSSLSLSTESLFWLLLSGVIGIGIGDTFFFKALTTIGDSQAVLITETLAPIFTALLAMIWIAEWITWQQWLGIAIVLLSVDMVVKINKRSATYIVPSSGYLYGVGAAVCQSLGAVISRDVLTSDTVSPSEAALLRLIGGAVIVTILMFATTATFKPLKQVSSGNAKLWTLFVLATLLGTTAAIYLQMLAFANAKAAVVQTLIATSAIMSLGVAWVVGEKASWKTLIWSATALIGVALLVSAGATLSH